jgi:hypothetical protein
MYLPRPARVYYANHFGWLSSSDTKKVISLFVSLVYCAESTVRWFVVREKHCWMAADSADKSKRTGRIPMASVLSGLV